MSYCCQVIDKEFMEIAIGSEKGQLFSLQINTVLTEIQKTLCSIITVVTNIENITTNTAQQSTGSNSRSFIQ